MVVGGSGKLDEAETGFPHGSRPARECSNNGTGRLTGDAEAVGDLRDPPIAVSGDPLRTPPPNQCGNEDRACGIPSWPSGRASRSLNWCRSSAAAFVRAFRSFSPAFLRAARSACSLPWSVAASFIAETR